MDEELHEISSEKDYKTDNVHYENFMKLTKMFLEVIMFNLRNEIF